MQTLGLIAFAAFIAIILGIAIKYARPSGRFDPKPQIPTALRNDGAEVKYTEPPQQNP